MSMMDLRIASSHHHSLVSLSFRLLGLLEVSQELVALDGTSQIGTLCHDGIGIVFSFLGTLSRTIQKGENNT